MSGTLRIREETRADHPAVRSVVLAAFACEPVADLLDALHESPRWVPPLSLVAEQDDEVVGHVSFTRGWVDAPRRLLDVLVLSPLSVLPDRQRTGVGSALVRAALELAEEHGDPLVFLEGDPGYYGRFGFEPAAAHGFVRPSTRIPEPAFQVRRLATYETWMRGALVYPDVFWAFDSVGLREP